MRLNKDIVVCSIILVITFLVFSPALKGEFLVWDDDNHVVDNAHVRSLAADNIMAIFSSRVNNTYIPLTTLVFAVEYHFFKLNPFIFHFTNIILHLGVCSLVFWLALRLRLTSIGAAMATLIFAIHPMHVESVAWITELKDVLYAIFYLGALHVYLSYIRFPFTGNGSKQKPAVRFYAWTILFGILSILAKPMAVSLPFILLLMDWFVGVRWTVKFG